MELTTSFVDLLQHFVPVFTTPTFQTFLQIVTGWVLSHRHRYLTEVIFAGGNVAIVALIGSNPLMSAGFVMVSESASLLMYWVRFPGLGWLLIHCGPLPPLSWLSRSIV